MKCLKCCFSITIEKKKTEITWKWHNWDIAAMSIYVYYHDIHTLIIMWKCNVVWIAIKLHRRGQCFTCSLYLVCVCALDRSMYAYGVYNGHIAALSQVDSLLAKYRQSKLFTMLMISTHNAQCTMHSTLPLFVSLYMCVWIYRARALYYVNFILMSLLTSLVVLIICSEHLDFRSDFLFSFFSALCFSVRSLSTTDESGPNIHVRHTILYLFPYCFVANGMCISVLCCAVCVLWCHLWHLLGFSWACSKRSVFFNVISFALAFGSDNVFGFMKLTIYALYAFQPHLVQFISVILFQTSENVCDNSSAAVATAAAALLNVLCA